MGEIVQFPGLATTQDIDPNGVLTGAVDKLDACMVIGIGTDGSLWLASSQGRVEWAHWMLNVAMTKLVEMEFKGKGW